MLNRTKLLTSVTAAVLAAVTFLLGGMPASAAGGYPNPHLKPLDNVSLVMKCPPTVKAGKVLHCQIDLVNLVRLHPMVFQMVLYKDGAPSSSAKVRIAPKSLLLPGGNLVSWKTGTLAAGTHRFKMSVPVPAVSRSPRRHTLHIMTMVSPSGNYTTGLVVAVNLKYVK